MPKFPFVFASLCLSLLSLPAADPLPGHSQHGEAFNEGPRQAATLIPGCGKVSFPITHTKPDAQAFFNQGVGQLHGFWYLEAERSFRQVAAMEPDCAMAYWGMAMANVNQDKRARLFLKKATERQEKASAKEKRWIASLENFYREDPNDKRDKRQRALDYIRDLETIVQEHPEDVEAKAFLAWKIWHANGDAPITSYQAVNALLDQVFAVNPEHPAHHYRIHLWDQRKPAQALKSAAMNGPAAPAIAHMWHMPGHTYSKLKRYDDAIWQQEASTRVDHAYMTRNWLHPDQIHNYAHNEEWLIRNYHELGRARDAIALATTLIRHPQHPAHNTLDKDSTSASYGRTRLLETLLRYELWDKVLEVTRGPLFPTVTQTAHEARRLHAQGHAFFAKKDSESLATTVKGLEALIAQETAKKKVPAPAKPKAGESSKAEAPKDNAKKQDQANPEKPKPTLAEKLLAELRALEAVLAKRKDAAELIRKATDLPKPLAARLWLTLGDKPQAKGLLKNYPQDLSGLAAKAEMLDALGQSDEARKTFEEVRKAAFAMDADLPVKKRLDALATRYGVKGDWRGKPPVRTDIGQRPALDTLGPMQGPLPVAPAWQAFTLEGGTFQSQALVGKPHVLLFYLGSTCTHCMEQVNAFAKAAADYQKAGFQILAITREPLSQAGRVAEQMSTKKLPPFPILSDPSLETFKAFRAYDDFEQEALHATLFMDASGRLRWIDISWQPFTDTAFLLREAQRLLSLDKVR